MKKALIISLFLFIIISALITFIPWAKWQKTYFNFLDEFRSKPQKHYDKQIEYAKYVEEIGTSPNVENKPDKVISVPLKKQNKVQKRKPVYIRDKNNPNILHPYKERKFLFFRFY